MHLLRVNTMHHLIVEELEALRRRGVASSCRSDIMLCCFTMREEKSPARGKVGSRYKRRENEEERVREKTEEKKKKRRRRRVNKMKLERVLAYHY